MASAVHGMTGQFDRVVLTGNVLLDMLVGAEWCTCNMLLARNLLLAMSNAWAARTIVQSSTYRYIYIYIHYTTPTCRTGYNTIDNCAAIWAADPHQTQQASISVFLESWCLHVDL